MRDHFFDALQDRDFAEEQLEETHKGYQQEIRFVCTRTARMACLIPWFAHSVLHDHMRGLANENQRLKMDNELLFQDQGVRC